ncbi:lactonase family protein [Marinoscillum furvescens]|uniref:Uncharacterized protein n=1 Tax=Marinoscillum furvescens DSM 4134 TaxID=1122208 RepID=A0A3D9L1D3_MARFU|nr:stress protein [Marinoscillum furvescens]RED95953.1 hypothetical protein C7460_11611 [Marinoscillum furvescens DSM 4134]
MNKIITLLLLLVCTIYARAQPQFELQEVSTVATSYNTVTSTVHDTGGGIFLYTAGDGNEIDVFQVNQSGVLALIKSYVVTGGAKTVRGLTTAQVEGKDFLFAGLKGGNAVEVFEIAKNGTLNSVFVLQDTDTTYLGIVITLQVVHMQSDSYLFVGGLEKTPGLSAFKIHADGQLTHIQSLADTEKIYTDGIIGMSIHTIADKTYLFTGGFQDNGLSSWRVYEDGRFENLSNIGDDRTLFLNGTYPVISATKKGWNYVIVGHRHHSYYKPTPWVKDRYSYYYHGDAVSVFWVNPKGELVPRSATIDDTQTLTKGQTRLHKLSYNDEYDIIAVATRDDQSLQLFMLNETGRLIPAGNIITGFPIYYGLSGQKIGDDYFLFAGSVENNTLKAYQLIEN